MWLVKVRRHCSCAEFTTSFKLKFSPDKVDAMVIQSIALLDDLDKEINIYSMRVKVVFPKLCCRDALINSLRNGTDGISQKWAKS